MKILEYCREKKIAFSVKPKILFLLFTSLSTNAVKTVETVFFSFFEKSQLIYVQLKTEICLEYSA